MKQKLIASDVKNFIRYDAETGKLFWLRRDKSHFKDERAWKIWNTRYADTEGFTAVTSASRKSRSGSIFGVIYLAHQVAWACYYGEWPVNTIDHINGDASDNRIVNLRDATAREQSMNMPMPASNTSGRIGVTKATNANRWIARIRSEGVHTHIGCFKTFEEASNARGLAEVACGYHENHGRKLA